MTLFDTRKQPLSATIYRELRAEIATLQLQPGALLSENSLAARYQTSRTPVRQALTRLEQDELIEVLPQRGARIAPLSVTKIREAQVVRESLELTAFRTAATIWRPGELEFRRHDHEIEANLGMQQESSEGSDFLAFTRLDGEFHAKFMAVAGNVMLLNVVETVRTHLMRMRYLEVRTMRHEEIAIGQHREIHEAVRSNDVAATSSLLIQHLGLLNHARDELISRHALYFTD